MWRWTPIMITALTRAAANFGFVHFSEGDGCLSCIVTHDEATDLTLELWWFSVNMCVCVKSHTFCDVLKHWCFRQPSPLIEKYTKPKIAAPQVNVVVNKRLDVTHLECIQERLHESSFWWLASRRRCWQWGGAAGGCSRWVENLREQEMGRGGGWAVLGPGNNSISG